MSRDCRDRRGGHLSKWYVSNKHHAWFTRNIRKRVRRAAKIDLMAGREPAPRTPLERIYKFGLRKMRGLQPRHMNQP